jgi:hypothetical protein
MKYIHTESLEAEGKDAPACVAASVGEDVGVRVGVSLGMAVGVAVGGTRVGEGWGVSVGSRVAVEVLVAVGKTSVAVGGSGVAEAGKEVGVAFGAAHPASRRITAPARRKAVRVSLAEVIIISCIQLIFQGLSLSWVDLLRLFPFSENPSILLPFSVPDRRTLPVDQSPGSKTGLSHSC